MGYPTDEDVFTLISDYHRDFGTLIPYEDARRLLVLYDEISELFERYNIEDPGEVEFLLA